MLGAAASCSCAADMQLIFGVGSAGRAENIARAARAVSIQFTVRWLPILAVNAVLVRLAAESL
jgi:hypothetical protein